MSTPDPDPNALRAAEAYEERFVPALFGEWAPRVVSAADLRPGQSVLDVATGTGVLAREAAVAVGPAGSVVGLDPAPAMLAVAARLAPDVAWQAGTAESLPFGDATFDAVVSQFGLMFFADRRRAVGEMLRVLRPGGRLAVAVWDGLDRTPAYAASVAVLERVAGIEAAGALRAPFVLGDAHALHALFEDAGVLNVRVASTTGLGRFPSIRAMAEGDLRGWLPVMGVHLDEDTIERVVAEEESALAAFATEDGSVRFDSPAHIVTGRAP